MAFQIELDQKATIDVVVSKDGAIDMTPEEYADYLNDVTKTEALKFKEGMTFDDCTKFRLKKTLSYKQTQKILEEQVTADMKGNTQVKIGWMLTELRFALVDIENPKNCIDPIPFKRGSDGNASEDLIAAIYNGGVIGDLSTARRNLADAKSGGLVKKK